MAAPVLDFPLRDPAGALGRALADLVSAAVIEAVGSAPIDDGQCLSVDDVADRLLVDRKTVYRLMDEDGLSWVQIRSQRRIKLVDLLAFQAGHRR